MKEKFENLKKVSEEMWLLLEKVFEKGEPNQDFVTFYNDKCDEYSEMTGELVKNFETSLKDREILISSFGEVEVNNFIITKEFIRYNGESFSRNSLPKVEIRK